MTFYTNELYSGTLVVEGVRCCTGPRVTVSRSNNVSGLKTSVKLIIKISALRIIALYKFHHIFYLKEEEKNVNNFLQIDLKFGVCSIHSMFHFQILYYHNEFK